jgi:hypothetical protein
MDQRPYPVCGGDPGESGGGAPDGARARACRAGRGGARLNLSTSQSPG